jgi:hypothetical protein
VVDAKQRYQVAVNGEKAPNDRFSTPAKAQNVANTLIKRARGNRPPGPGVGKFVQVIDLANGRVLGESKDGSPIRKLKV